MAGTPPVCNFGWEAPGFTLPATDGRTLSLADIKGERGTLVMFICNHCPYVIGIRDRIIRDAEELLKQGVGVAAISSNDATAYPADSFDKMRELAKAENFPFPYLYDEDQSAARAYGAVCTPDFFGFNADLGLQYRGRLDGARMGQDPTGAPRDLFNAMVQIAETGNGPKDQIPSMGCSIKWKDKN